MSNKSAFIVMHSFVLSVILLFVLSVKAFGYLIIVDNTVPADTVIFNGTLSSFRHPDRKYFMNVEKSASFVEKLVYVNSSTGTVHLKQPLSCDGLEYPNVFTFFIDSSSAGIYEYISVPLKVYVHGCEPSGDKGEMINFESTV